MDHRSYSQIVRSSGVFLETINHETQESAISSDPERRTRKTAWVIRDSDQSRLPAKRLKEESRRGSPIQEDSNAVVQWTCEDQKLMMIFKPIFLTFFCHKWLGLATGMMESLSFTRQNEHAPVATDPAVACKSSVPEVRESNKSNDRRHCKHCKSSVHHHWIYHCYVNVYVSIRSGGSYPFAPT